MSEISEKGRKLLDQYWDAVIGYERMSGYINYEEAEEMALDELSSYIAALEAEVAELEAERRWIPVSERLPEIDDDDVKEYDVVLTYPYEQEVITATWSYDNTGKTCRRLWLDCRSDEWSAVDITEHVTHWRERPTPPEVQE